MSQSEFREYDFENPSLLYKLEDFLKRWLAPFFMYGPYIRKYNLKGSERVLDFGCGGGVSSLILLKYLDKGGKLTGVDTSRYWIERARRRLRKYLNANCIHGDIRELNLPPESFDVISIIYVLHDIPPDIRKESVQALLKTLNHGGKVYIREPIRESHGMPAEEIVQLMFHAGLDEIHRTLRKKEYLGIFAK
ncbi:MAG: class I SAM-dependent methyltransferase [Calditrichaeota bacterium]|nr:class I SAM-dependent methyltransferase [Calditrichota bacterium]RQW03769.1 MAG: class I SAM-dependent methyltransferase [Calditrichota bacterium]